MFVSSSLRICGTFGEIIPMKVHHLKHSLLALLGLVVLAATAQALVAPKVLKLDFNSTAAFTESDGVAGTATASGLTAAEKAAIIALVQQRYDKALGPGMVMVMEGTGGDVDMIVNGGNAPGVNAGKEYGDAGKPGMPGVAHKGEFGGLAGADLTNALGETIAHEAGHKLGLEHNWDNRPTLMTEGSKVTLAQRKAGTRKFNAADGTGLTKNLALVKAEQTERINPLMVGDFVGSRVGPLANKPDDLFLDSFATLNAPPGWEFGYMSYTGEFVFQGDWTNTNSNPAFMTFIYSAGVDLAVRLNSTIHKLSDGTSVATYVLSNVNPDNPAVFQRVVATFPGNITLTVQATIDPTTGGFRVPSTSIPTVPQWGLILMALLFLAVGARVISRPNLEPA